MRRKGDRKSKNEEIIDDRSYYSDAVTLLGHKDE